MAIYLDFHSILTVNVALITPTFVSDYPDLGMRSPRRARAYTLRIHVISQLDPSGEASLAPPLGKDYPDMRQME